MTALYRLFLGFIVTKGRVIGLLSLGAVAVVVGYAVGNNSASDHIEDGTLMIAGLGLSLITPVVTLVLASAVLGDPNEDGTLVYLWHRPVPRWHLAVSAALAALTVSLPIVVIPMTIAAAATNAGSELVVATAVSCSVAAVAYSGIFMFLGLRVKRAMAWGLAYILVWEGFVASAGAGAEFVSVRAHTTSLLTRLADGPRRLESSSTATAIIVPLAAAVAAVYLTMRRLQRQDVA
jgi:ABC-2 type transport system permease protein